MTNFESGKKREPVQVDIDMTGELPRILRLTLERHRREAEEDKEAGRSMRTRRVVEVLVVVVSLLLLLLLLCHCCWCCCYGKWLCLRSLMGAYGHSLSVKVAR